MILSDSQIQAAISSGAVTVEPFDDRQIQPASIDLRVGEQGATTKLKKKTDIKETGFITVEPGDFAVICILEIIKLDAQHAGRIGLRSKYARKGLIATTGPQIDPGFRGRLKLGVTNLTPKPVVIPYKDDILTLEIHKLDEPAKKPYSGPYQDQTELSSEDLEVIGESDGMAFSEVLTTLRSLSASVGGLASQMKTMQWVIPVVVGVGTAFIAIIVSLG